MTDSATMATVQQGSVPNQPPSPSSGVNLICGVVLVIASQIMSQVDSTKEVNSYLVHFYRLFPRSPAVALSPLPPAHLCRPAALTAFFFSATFEPPTSNDSPHLPHVCFLI